MKSVLGAVALAAVLAGCGGYDRGDDPYRNAVSDRRAPDVIVTVRDEAGEPVADVGYDASNGRVPIRGTSAALQTLDGDAWSTVYTLSRHLDNGFMEGALKDVSADAYGGPGPDTYRLPHLDTDDAYRICISFVIRHQGATSCSAPFHSRVVYYWKRVIYQAVSRRRMGWWRTSFSRDRWCPARSGS